MDQRIDILAALQVDLTVNIAAVSGLAADVPSLHHARAPLPAIQRALIQGGPSWPHDNRLRNRLAAFIHKLALRDHEEKNNQVRDIWPHSHVYLSKHSTCKN